MSTSQKDKEQTQTMILVPFAALVIIVAFIPFIKYVPIVFLAIPFALMFYDNLLAQSAFSKFKSTLWTLVFSAFILYFLFGFPSEKGYYGFIPLYPLKNILENLISLHDGFLSKFSKISPANVQKGLFGTVGFMEVSRYFWYLLPAGFIEALLLYGLCEWRKKHFSTGLGTISKTALKPILRLIQKPILKALDKEWEPKSALFVTVILYVAMIYSTECEKFIAQNFSHSHPFMFLFFLIFTVGVFYFMGMMLLTARAFSQRTKLFHLFVPYVDLLLSPVIWLLSIDLSSNDNKIDFSRVVPLGSDILSNKPVLLTEKNLNYHTQVIGGSGAGKTNLIKNVIASRVFGNKGLIFLDLKADFDTVVWMKKLSVAAGRDQEFKLFSMANPEISL
ncbi:hypothetical protein K2X05_07545, partial [bacterium]|nr:hypothetical protein [bacterium]